MKREKKEKEKEKKNRFCTCEQVVSRKARGGVLFAMRSELSLSGPYSCLKGSSGLIT